MKDQHTHVCPVWIGRLLASPVRRLFQHPDKILGPHVRQGMTVLDAGSALGYFSLPMARMVGEKGRVICLDVQSRMLEGLERRARKAGLNARIETRLVEGRGLGLDDLKGKLDFVLAFAVLHETPDPPAFIADLANTLKPGGRFLVSEPTGHVTQEALQHNLRGAREHGLIEVDRPTIRGGRSVLFEARGE